MIREPEVKIHINPSLMRCTDEYRRIVQVNVQLLHKREHIQSGTLFTKNTVASFLSLEKLEYFLDNHVYISLDYLKEMVEHRSKIVDLLTYMDEIGWEKFEAWRRFTQ